MNTYKPLYYTGPLAFVNQSPEEIRYTCEECEYCKTYSKVFSWEIVTREADQKQVLHKTKNYCYVNLCVRDLDHIKEVNSYDDVCEDHGELSREV